KKYRSVKIVSTGEFIKSCASSGKKTI
ncbi:hypothetical protein LCGC14_2723580, partial [marine sediment metagenome]